LLAGQDCSDYVSLLRSSCGVLAEQRKWSWLTCCGLPTFRRVCLPCRCLMVREKAATVRVTPLLPSPHEHSAGCPTIADSTNSPRGSNCRTGGKAACELEASSLPVHCGGYTSGGCSGGRCPCQLHWQGSVEVSVVLCQVVLFLLDFRSTCPLCSLPALSPALLKSPNPVSFPPSPSLPPRLFASPIRLPLACQMQHGGL